MLDSRIPSKRSSSPSDLFLFLKRTSFFSVHLFCSRIDPVGNFLCSTALVCLAWPLQDLLYCWILLLRPQFHCFYSSDCSHISYHIRWVTTALLQHKYHLLPPPSSHLFLHLQLQFLNTQHTEHHFTSSRLTTFSTSLYNDYSGILQHQHGPWRLRYYRCEKARSTQTSQARINCSQMRLWNVTCESTWILVFEFQTLPDYQYQRWGNHRCGASFSVSFEMNMQISWTRVLMSVPRSHCLHSILKWSGNDQITWTGLHFPTRITDLLINHHSPVSIPRFRRLTCDLFTSCVFRSLILHFRIVYTKVFFLARHRIWFYKYTAFNNIDWAVIHGQQNWEIPGS